MATVAELLRQGRSEELWQMCCGYTGLNIEQFMAIQKRLLLEQLELLNNCALGVKIMSGSRPRTVEEFRRQAPLTTYADYLPELADKREDILPALPAIWVRSSGKSGEYACKWVPITHTYSNELSILMYGLGNLSNCRDWGDTSNFPDHPKLIYSVAPRPYMTGSMACMLALQAPPEYIPSLEEAEKLPFEDRIALGFKQALARGIDYFFGLSLVLVSVGEKFSQPSGKTDIRSLLSRPRALLRLLKGVVKSKLARRPMLPRDLWSVKGIISSGVDSSVYRDRIKKLWGRYPLDVYASTEGGIIATQTWDYESMTFIPNLNFLEFIPEKERFKWQLDHSYRPKTVLLDEVIAGEDYELVLTSFHGGAMIRYKNGDMVRITSLRNEKLGIDIPQMVFERRADDLIDFNIIRLTEKTIWQALERTGVGYKDWTAYKEPGQMVLRLFVELKNGCSDTEQDIAAAVYDQIMKPGNDDGTLSAASNDVVDMINFSVKVDLLPSGAFAGYTAHRQAEGADIAHLKPPHVNPPDKVLELLQARPRIKVRAKTPAGATSDKVPV